MNYYLDFDHTLYHTPELTKRMLRSIAHSVKSKKADLDEEALLDECNSLFGRGKMFYKIYEFAEYFSDKYGMDSTFVRESLDRSILNCNDVVHDDVIDFLNKLKNAGHKVYMLSYQPFGLDFAMKKIIGSGLTEYFDAIYPTSQPKYELDINYANGIFIDDSPKDLAGLHSKGGRVIRIRRPGDTYSDTEMPSPLDKIVPEYSTLNDIPVLGKMSGNSTLDDVPVL